MSNCCSNKANSKKSDPRLKILIILVVIVIAGGVAGGIYSVRSEQNSELSELKTGSLSHDFGTISMSDGLVKHNFTIENKGAGDLRISNIKTSCMCTTAVLENEGKRSPVFSMHGNPTVWSQKLKPGQAANLEVTFDPNAHGPNATGPITRTVTMYSNDGGRESVKTNFTFTANVIK